MSYELVTSVVGLTNNYKETFGTRPGIGKSCLCFRLAYPEYDNYVDDHPSLFALHEFESRAINSNHFVYWGSPLKFFPVRGGDCKVKFHIIEQTVFYQDVTSLPFNHSVTKPDNVDSYVKRIVGPIESTGKISYHSRDSIVTGMPAGHAVANYPSGITRLPRGFVVVFDVSVTGKALSAQCKRLDPILSYLDKHKKKFIIAVTKRDKYSMPSLEKAYELRKKYRTHLVECSALDDLNMEEVLRVLALIVISKKVSGLSDQVARYHDAAQHALVRRTSAKSAFKSYVRKRVTNYDERLVSVQLSEEFKECARWIGSYKTGCMFALHVLELYNGKVEELYAGVTDDPDMHTEYLEDFVDQRKDIEAFKVEMRRWITSYVSEFSHTSQSKKQPQPEQTHQSNEGGSNSTSPSHSSQPAETTTRSEHGGTHPSTTTDVTGSLSPPPPPATPITTSTTTPISIPTKPGGQIPEGYHIFESLSKVSKNGSMKQENEEEADQSSKDVVRSGEIGGGATEATDTSPEEKSTDGQEGGNDEDVEADTASIYSVNSMESVPDHDYLNFDPKSGGVWLEESDVPSPTTNAPPDSQGLPVDGKDDDDDSDDGCDYENLRDFIGNTDYMNVGEVIQSIHEVPHSKSDTLHGGEPAGAVATSASSSSHCAPCESCETSHGERADQTDNTPTTVAQRNKAPLPKVSPKPVTRKTIKAPPPLVLPTPSLNPPCQKPPSEPSPSISSSDTTSSLPPPTENAASTSSQLSPRLKKPRPVTPVRRSSLYNKSSTSPLLELPTQDSRSSPSAQPHKPQKPVGRSSSIRQRAKLLEMSMTSSSMPAVSIEDLVVSEESTTGQNVVKETRNDEDVNMPVHNTGHLANNGLDLPPVPELMNGRVAEDSQVPTPLVTNGALAAVTTGVEATPSPNTKEREVGGPDSSSQLSLQAQRLAGLTSPANETVVPKAANTSKLTDAGATITSSPLHAQTSAMANGTTILPTENSSSSSSDPQAVSAFQGRPRLTQIRNKLAQKKEVTTMNGSSALNGTGSSVGGVHGSSSQSDSRATMPAKRPNLATIKKRLKEIELETADVPQLESELAKVSPFGSINLPPLPARPTSAKRGSAPASSIAQSLSPERLKEWNAKGLGEGKGLPNEAPPPLPKRTKANFQIAPTSPADPVTRHKEYFNVLMKTKNDSSTAKPVTLAEHSNITSPSKEPVVPLPKKRGMANVETDRKASNEVAKKQPSPKTKSKKDEKDQTQKEQQTSPIKKAFAYLTVRNKDNTSTKQKDEVVPQTRARFMNMANRPLPMIPGHSYNSNDEPDHTEKDYEEFGCNNGSGGVEVEYLNYPELPAAVAYVHGNRGGRSQSQEPELPTPTTRSAPNSPMILGKSQTLGRPRNYKSVFPSRQLSRDDDGYINSDLLPDPLEPELPYRVPIPINAATGNVKKIEAQGSQKSEDSNDYDYPDLRLTGAFSTPHAKQQAITKLERSKISAYDFQQPRKTQEVRTWGVSSNTDKESYGGEEGDEEGLRDRTWSTASSSYVPMAALDPSDDEDDYVPPNVVDVDKLTQKFLISKSASDSGSGTLSNEVDGQEDVAQRQEGSNECETVYMNLPMPEKVSAIHYPLVTSPKPPTTSSMDDSHVSNKTKYPVVKPKPTKKRSATIAAKLPAEGNTAGPHEGWNKTGIIKESDDQVPPRNVPRESMV